MNSFIHTLEDGLEQYSFPSALHARQRHYIDRVDGGRWELSIVNLPETIPIEDARTLAAELHKLIEFMGNLDKEAANV